MFKAVLLIVAGLLLFVMADFGGAAAVSYCLRYAAGRKRQPGFQRRSYQTVGTGFKK